MNAVIYLDVPEWQIGQDVSVYFPDTMLKRGKCELPKEQEIKTGKWEPKPPNEEQDERPFIWWICSECGQVIYSESERDRKEFHKYCSRCGSLMT